MQPLALVTGASAGIGREITAELLKRNYRVIGVGASERIHNLLSVFPEQPIEPVQADLATPEGIETVWAAVRSTERALDVAALNAGRSLGGAFIDTDLADELDMIALNITGQVRLAKHVARHMSARGNGDILITTSLSATTPTPYESIYGPTRAFMYSFAQGLREELRGHGVNVTALLPGATATEFHATAGMSNTIFGSNDWKNDPAVVARQGVDAMFAGKDHVVGGNASTKRAGWINRILGEQAKARRFAEISRPDGR